MYKPNIMMGDKVIMACKVCGCIYTHIADGSYPQCPRCLANYKLVNQVSKPKKFFIHGLASLGRKLNELEQ